MKESFSGQGRKSFPTRIRDSAGQELGEFWVFQNLMQELGETVIQDFLCLFFVRGTRVGILDKKFVFVAIGHTSVFGGYFYL